MMNMRGPRPMPHPGGPHGLPGHTRPPGSGMRPPGPGMRPPGPMGIGPGPGPMGIGPGPGPMGLPRPQGPVPLHMSQVVATNKTNDPRGAHCRLFVGNLNTIMIKKEDVEAIFRRYGIVTGISMHKGYAFVQYGAREEAKRAAASEDGKMYAGQTLDINIASEPKKGTKRAAQSNVKNNVNKQSPAQKKAKLDTGNTTSAAAVAAGAGARAPMSLGSGLKDATIEASSTSITLSRPTGKALKKTTISTGNDILICGNCKSLHSSLATFVQHKKQKCELKKQCVCHQLTAAQENSVQKHEKSACEPDRSLLCAVCDTQFKTAWDLCQHCQEEHSIAIFKEEQLEDSMIKKEEADNSDSAELNGDNDKE